MTIRLGRLRREAEFRIVRSSPRRATNPLLTAQVAPAEAPNPSLLCLAVVAGKRLGGAVTRNRIRRRLRAAARTLLPHLSGSWLVVIYPRAKVAQADFRQIVESLEGAFRQLGLWEAS